LASVTDEVLALELDTVCALALARREAEAMRDAGKDSDAPELTHWRAEMG
jgi:hypothetical protein